MKSLLCSYKLLTVLPSGEMGLNGEINKTVAIAGECAKGAPHCLFKCFVRLNHNHQ